MQCSAHFVPLREHLHSLGEHMEALLGLRVAGLRRLEAGDTSVGDICWKSGVVHSALEPTVRAGGEPFDRRVRTRQSCAASEEQ